jgi:hypothetical protein
MDTPWILRNLTTREYVRAEAIAIKPEYIHGPFINVLGFGEVVTSRICWSPDPSCSMNSDSITRGPWAGHCFDIVPHRLLEREIEQQKEKTQTSWRDISDDVASDIAAIWESEWGEDWRTEFTTFIENTKQEGEEELD